MLIGKNYKIESDSLNVILSKKVKRTNKVTKEKYDSWKILGYFATIKGALHELVNQRIRDTELTDIKKVEAEIASLKKMIEGLAK